MPVKETHLQQLFDEYVDECRFTYKLRPATIRGYAAVFSHFSKFLPDDATTKTLSRRVMTDFFKYLETRERIVGKDTVRVGVKPSTTSTYYRKLNAFFKWLSIKGYIEENPLSTIHSPHAEYTDRRNLVGTDTHKIITAIQLHSKNELLLKRDMAMISTLLFCGVRKGELLGLKVTDVNFEKRLLQVRGETSKSKKTRHIPMSHTLSIHLQGYIAQRNIRRYKTEHLWVSGNGDTAFTEHGLKHWVKRLNDLSGVRFHLHRFRHTFAHNLAEQNVSVIKIQKLLGHSDIRMTQVYLRAVSAEDCRDEIEKLVVDGLM